MNVAVSPGVDPTAGADVIGNRHGRNEGITAVDGNHLARKGRRCGDPCEHDRGRRVCRMDQRDWPSGAFRRLGGPRPWEFNKRAQPVSIVRCTGGSILRVIADAKTLENQLNKTLWCGWYRRGTRIRGVFVSARKLHSEVGPL